jgi:hypothetical protein
VIVAAGSAGSATVTGLAATVSIENAETPGDALTVSALAVMTPSTPARRGRDLFDGGTGDVCWRGGVTRCQGTTATTS